MSVVEEELCRTITLIANNYQKVSNRISNIKKPQKVYEKRSIRMGMRHIIAVCPKRYAASAAGRICGENLRIR